MKKVRQVSAAISGANDRAILPEQPGPFLLHSAYFTITPTAAALWAILRIKFGGVAECVAVPVWLDDSNGYEFEITWMRGGVFLSLANDTGTGSIDTDQKIVLPLPSNMVLDSQFEVSVHVPDIDVTQDQASEVSFLIEDVQPDK